MKKIIIISAVWCPSCLILNKEIKNIKNEFPNLEIEKLDYDLDDIEEYNVGNTLPVIILKEDNTEIDRLIGEKSYDEVKEFLRWRNYYIYLYCL